jgi:hypothetical protein
MWDALRWLSNMILGIGVTLALSALGYTNPERFSRREINDALRDGMSASGFQPLACPSGSS